MGNRCQICGTSLDKDLFSAVTGELVCTICKIKFIGGLPTTPARVQQVRDKLGLTQGEYLQQDNVQEAAQIVAEKVFHIKR